MNFVAFFFFVCVQKHNKGQLFVFPSSFLKIVPMMELAAGRILAVALHTPHCDTSLLFVHHIYFLQRH